MKTDTAFIVIDTNVLISAALLPQSKTAQVLRLALRDFVLAQNEATWGELESRIQRPKFDRYFGENGRMQYLAKIAQIMQRFPQVSKVVASRDATDDKFLALAIDAQAPYLISGDPDLLTLGVYRHIEILSPSSYFDRVSSAN
jgi:putative PIN family toxin of toxin-antitoxin system